MVWSDSDRFAELLKRVRGTAFQTVLKQVSEDLPDKPTYRDFEYGLRTLFTHIETDVPEVLAGGLNIVEIGPGVGCFMLLAKALGNSVWGEEDRNQGVVRAYQKITGHWGLSVKYGGFQRYLTGEPFPYHPGTIDLFHLRGSLDAILAPFSNLEQATHQLLGLLERALTLKGVIWIGHNDTPLREPILRAIQSYQGNLRIVPTPTGITRMRLTDQGVLNRLLLQSQEQGFQDLLNSLSSTLPPATRDFRENILREHRYLCGYFPQLASGGCRVLDVGPGTGGFLLVARTFGNEVYGIEQDAPTRDLSDVVQEAHRGFLHAYKELADYWGLNIMRLSFHRFLGAQAEPFPFSDLDLIHFQKSLDGVLLRYPKESYGQVVRELCLTCLTALKPGGLLCFQHNPPIDEARLWFSSLPPEIRVTHDAIFTKVERV